MATPRPTGPAIRVIVPRELISLNRFNGRHWATKHVETQDWEKDIWFGGASAQFQGPATERCAVRIVRVVPNHHRFIRDQDNLYGACKPVLDALKRLRLIVDDAQAWLYLPPPEQRQSADGSTCTEITITPIGAKLEGPDIRPGVRHRSRWARELPPKRRQRREP